MATQVNELPPYWATNVDPPPNECPDFLKKLNDRDIAFLTAMDETYRRDDWSEVKLMIYTKRYDMFRRVPSELRKYLEFKNKVTKEYGSPENYLIKERLHWDGDLTPKSQEPFHNPSDYKILLNDWPYGLDKRIVHLTVWCKFHFETDPESLIDDNLSPRATRQINQWVTETFGRQAPKSTDVPIPRDVHKMAYEWGPTKIKKNDVAWFRNWKGIKTVDDGKLEHFHVLLNDPDPEFVRKISNNDVPLWAKTENKW